MRVVEMSWPFNLLIGFIVAVVVAKNLHVKETYSYTEKNDEVQFQDFYNYDDNVYTPKEIKERFARHVELVTENVLEHLLQEINNKYSHSRNHSQDNMPKMMQRLKMTIKRHLNKNRHQKLKNKLSRMNVTNQQETSTTGA